MWKAGVIKEGKAGGEKCKKQVETVAVQVVGGGRTRSGVCRNPTNGGVVVCKDSRKVCR